MVSQYAPPSYGDGYVYSDGAIVAGLLGGLMPIILLLGVMLVTVYNFKGTLKQVKIKPIVKHVLSK